ncbi:MAG TPA: hypothetical protein VIC87_01470, partial [Vicinamibacteria bacterium]
MTGVRVTVSAGSSIRGDVAVPGDKSIAHRWLILAATARGSSVLRDLPVSLDARSTARCLASVCAPARPPLEAWASGTADREETDRFTWDGRETGRPKSEVRVEGEGRRGLAEPAGALDCGNSGTTLRLLSGVVAAAPFRTVLTGDESLASRPMERVAGPLREMGASVRTTDGHAPVEIEGARLRGIRHRPAVASAQVKGAVLLAG